MFIRPLASRFRLLPALVLASILVGLPVAEAAPKKSSTGENCSSTGTARRDGKDAETGEKLNCLFDYCTYCSTSGGQIDCTKMITEYSNGRDCKAAKAGIRGQSGVTAPGAGVLDPVRKTPRPRPAGPLGGKLNKAN